MFVALDNIYVASIASITKRTFIRAIPRWAEHAAIQQTVFNIDER